MYGLKSIHVNFLPKLNIPYISSPQLPVAVPDVCYPSATLKGGEVKRINILLLLNI